MSFYKDKKVLVAGGAGLIGQSLIRHLTVLGARVYTTEFRTRKIADDTRIRVRSISFDDLMRPPWSLYEGTEIVFWAAAKVGGAALIKGDPMGLVHYNLELAARNIKMAVAAGVDRFCYVSSSYVYPEVFETAAEDDTEKADVPLGHYGLGWVKRFIEKLCKAHQLTGSTKFALVRPAAIYGPYDNFDLLTCHVVPALICKVAEGQNPLEVWGDGSEERQFTYVDDLVKGMLLATQYRCDAEPINIATDEVSTVNDVWRTLFEIEGLVAQPPFSADAPLTWTIPSGPQYREIKYLGDKPKVISRRVVNTDRCKAALGYQCKTSLRDGLAKTLEWYKSHHDQRGAL